MNNQANYEETDGGRAFSIAGSATLAHHRFMTNITLTAVIGGFHLRASDKDKQGV
jgi:hypothetical protein